MRLQDIFRPKWKHPDFKVRLAAIDRTLDDKILSTVIQQDQHPEVRIAAIRKARNWDLLENLAKSETNPQVRKEAALRFISHCGETKALALLREINDQSLIADVAVRPNADRNITAPAIRMLTDPQMLARVVMEVEDSYLIGLAVKAIQDESLLIDLLGRVKSYMGPYMIIKEGKFSDESLQRIAQRYPERRAEALKRMKDPAAAARIGLSSDKVADRLAVVEVISDQAMLLDVARTDKDLGVRVAAAAKLTDRQMAAEITGGLLDEMQRGLGGGDWPEHWRSLENGPRLLKIITENTRTSDCPYFKMGVCKFRIMTGQASPYGAEACSWQGGHQGCHVWQLAPR